MSEESSPLLPPAEESIEAESDTPLEPELECGEPTPEPASEPGFVCGCEVWMRSACKGLPFFSEYEHKGEISTERKDGQKGIFRYCVLHYPGKEKSADFKAAVACKLNNEDFDFRGVRFPDEVDFNGFEFSAAADFRSATFSKDADFSSATFSAAASFISATFSAAAYFRSATFSAHASFRSATFSAAAYFSNATFIRAASFSSATFSADADFSSATFSARAHFSSATFGAPARFSSATFSAEAYFISATFSADADLSYATFNGSAYFSEATFSADADFSEATFSAAASFRSATFSADADFISATFSADASFRSATFKSAANFDRSLFHANAIFTQASVFDSLHFFGSPTKRELPDGETLPPMSLGKEPSLDFQHVTIEHPERVAFHTLILRPHWFVNADPRLFQLTDVDWQWKQISVREEIEALEDVETPSRIRLFLKACRQLAENAEANNRYEESSRFRYLAMDLARRTKWKGWSFWKKSCWKTDWLHMLYWAVSGYGERILRALAVLAMVWIVFALSYMWVGFEQPLPRERALTYSLAVMSLQKPDPKPLTGTAQTLVLLETILGPVQAALLALAIRRKFMR